MPPLVRCKPGLAWFNNATSLPETNAVRGAITTPVWPCSRANRLKRRVAAIRVLAGERLTTIIWMSVAVRLTGFR